LEDETENEEEDELEMHGVGANSAKLQSANGETQGEDEGGREGASCHSLP
jgi:hypothetical protein